MYSALQFLKALSDLNRLRIVAALDRYEELCVCQITELLQVTGATVSRHLAILQRAGLLASRKEGRWIYFRLAPPADAEALMDWLAASAASSDQLRADADALDAIVEITREDLCRQQRGEACCPDRENPS